MTETSKTSLALARTRYPKKDREAIAAYHRVDPENPVVPVLLSFCVQYDLDPLGGHVWLTDENFERTVAKDGDPAPKIRDAGAELKVGITRDGLLFLANRNPAYGGMEHDVVCENDSFQVKRDGGDVSIFHEYPELPGGDAEGRVEDYRGEIVGAYCKTFVEGRKPTYYFAFMKEHGQFDVGDDEKREFYGAWKYQSAMILKAPQSVTLRLALGVTGVVGLDEIKRGKEDAPVAAASPTPMEDPAEYLAGLDLEKGLRTELTNAVERVNDLQANAWSLAKLKMRLEGTGKEGALAVLGEILDEIEKRRQQAAPATASA